MKLRRLGNCMASTQNQRRGSDTCACWPDALRTEAASHRRGLMRSASWLRSSPCSHRWISESLQVSSLPRPWSSGFSQALLEDQGNCQHIPWHTATDYAGIPDHTLLKYLVSGFVYSLERTGLPLSFHRSGVSHHSEVTRPRYHPLRTRTD